MGHSAVSLRQSDHKILSMIVRMNGSNSRAEFISSLISNYIENSDNKNVAILKHELKAELIEAIDSAGGEMLVKKIKKKFGEYALGLLHSGVHGYEIQFGVDGDYQAIVFVRKSEISG